MERRRRRRTSGRTSRQVKKVLKKIKPAWIIKAILYGLGVYCFLYCKREYAVTLISFQTIVVTGIIAGLILSFIIERQFKYYLFSIVLFGSLFVATLFKVNRSFASNKEEKIKAQILNKAIKSAKTEGSRVTIEYNDFSKDIDIDRIQEYKMAPSDFIILTARKGALGYYVITYKELVDQ